MAVTEHELSQHNKMVERVYICKEKKKKMNRRKRGVSVRGSEKSRRQAVHADHAMPGTLVAIGASRVGIENTSSCPINRRSHAVTVKKSEFSCVLEEPVACRRASAWCRCRAREHDSLCTRSRTCTR